MKQKESNNKGDWFRMLVKDFEFIQVEMKEDTIISTPKEQYRKLVKNQVMKSAFKSYIELKEKSKKKLKDLVYEDIKIQSYMNEDNFSLNEKKLLFALRPKSYKARMNFKKTNRNNLNCSLNCNTEKTQLHIFQSCRPILDKLGLTEIPSFNLIYGTPKEQKCAMEVFIKIDDMRKHIQDNILPGGQIPGPKPARPQIP